MQLPRGYGYQYRPTDSWIMNYMIHNLTPEPTKVSITYDIDFVPDGTATAQKLDRARPLWMDVSGLAAYPVFDAFKGQGKKGKFTFPDQARASQQDDIGRNHEITAPRDMTLLRHGRPPASRRPLHRSQGHARLAHQGAVQVGGQVLRARGRGLVGRLDDPHQAELAGGGEGGRPPERVGHLRHQQGVVVRVDGDHGRLLRPGRAGGAKDPFKSSAVPTRGLLTHGHLRENRNHGGSARPRFPDARDPGERSVQLEPGHQGVRVRARGPERLRQARTPAGGTRGTVDHVHEPGRANDDVGAAVGLPHDHLVQGSLYGSTGIAYPLANAKTSSTRASSGTARPDSRRRRTGTRGRPRRASRRGPTRTSAGSTRSCGAPSASVDKKKREPGSK